jgi:hypothetical protein
MSTVEHLQYKTGSTVQFTGDVTAIFLAHLFPARLSESPLLILPRLNHTSQFEKEGRVSGRLITLSILARIGFFGRDSGI